MVPTSWAPGGPPMPIFCYMESFIEEKIISKLSGRDSTATNPKVVNDQRIKHYILGNPINVETNVIETVTPEEYIRDTF